MQPPIGSLSNTTSKNSWKFWAAVILLLGILFWINGIKLMPHQLYQKLAQNPFILRTDIDKENYFQETVLLPLLAYYTGWNDPLSFNALSFFILIAGYLFFAKSVLSNFGPKTALIFSSIILSSPVSTILLSWLGSPDSLTFLLTIPLLFSNSAIVILVIGILGVTNHIVFGLAAFEILVLRWMAKDGINFKLIALQLFAGMIGYLLIWLYFTVNNIHVFSRLDFILSKGLASWFFLNQTNFSLTILSFFNIQWLLLLTFIILFFRKDPKYYFSVCIFLLFNYGITFFTLDKTRIFSILSWGVFTQSMLRSYMLSTREQESGKNHKAMFFKVLTGIGILSFLMPRFYSWDGHIFVVTLWKIIFKFFLDAA